MHFRSYVVTEVMAVRPVTVSKDLSKLYVMGQQILYNRDISVPFYTFLFNSLQKGNRAEVNAVCFFYLSAH